MPSTSKLVKKEAVSGTGCMVEAPEGSAGSGEACAGPLHGMLEPGAEELTCNRLNVVACSPAV
jgi:hypothetical protein